MDSQIRLAIIAIVIVIPSAVLIVWHSDKQESIQYVKTNVVALASFYPLLEFTNKISGQTMDVSLLVPPGVEPHDWEPTIHDIEQIRRADLIIINGAGFEKWTDNIDEINPTVTIIDSSVGIEIISSENYQLYGNEQLSNPHIWLNPVLAKTQVQNIANGLVKFNPENEERYRKNAEQYISKLDDLALHITDELSSCKTDFITYHNAFSYFANQYDLIQHTIVKNNNLHEPTPRHFEDLINLVQELEIDVIFTEDGIDERISKVIANEFNVTVLKLYTMEIVYNNSTYIENMEKNISNLKKALCN